MEVKEWLDKEGLKAWEFAKSISMPKSSIYAYLKGECAMSIAWAIIIEKKTRGEVTTKEIHAYTKRFKEKVLR